MDSEKSAGAPACLYASLGGKVDLPPLSLPKLPTDLREAKFKVASVVDGEDTSANPNGTTSFSLTLRSGIVGSGQAGSIKGDKLLDFDLQGMLSPDGRFTRFTVVLNDSLGENKPEALSNCSAKTELNDLGKYRVVLDFAIEGSTYKAKNIGCIIKALPKTAAFEADFLTTSLSDVAIGLVSSGDVEGIRTQGLRAFFNSLARGEIVVTKGADVAPDKVASIDPAALPKPDLVIKTTEKFVKNSGKAVEIISLLRSQIKGATKGQNDIEFTVLGHYAYSTDAFTDLSFIIQEPLGKDRPEVLNQCPGSRTEFYDGAHHAVITLTPRKDGWEADKVNCLIANLPPKQAFVAKFLVTSLRDIAIGLVKSGDVKLLENDGLRTFMSNVATGKIKVAASLP